MATKSKFIPSTLNDVCCTSCFWSFSKFAHRTKSTKQKSKSNQQWESGCALILQQPFHFISNYKSFIFIIRKQYLIHSLYHQIHCSFGSVFFLSLNITPLISLIPKRYSFLLLSILKIRFFSNLLLFWVFPSSVNDFFWKFSNSSFFVLQARLVSGSSPSLSNGSLILRVENGLASIPLKQLKGDSMLTWLK